MTVPVVAGKVVNPEGLEINATFNCNMRCRSCSHLSPLYRKSAVDPAELADSLALLTRSYHASYVKILGGEPLMHPDLLGVIEAVRSSAISDAILVCTNGTLLDRAPERFWESVDAVEISMYPSRPRTEEELARFRELADAHGVDLLVNTYTHFRYAHSEAGTDSPELIRRIFNTCKLAHVWLSHTLHDGWLYRCPQSVVFPDHVANADWDRTVDGIKVESGPDFVARLHAFVNRTTPLRACRNCLGSVGAIHPHAELPRTQLRQPLPTEEVLDWEFLAAAERDITIDDGCVATSVGAPVGTSTGHAGDHD